MMHVLTAGTRVIPVYVIEDEMYLGRSKVLTRHCLVPEICPVPTGTRPIVHESYRFSPFERRIRYKDRRHVVSGHASAEIFEHVCCGFLFKYAP